MSDLIIREKSIEELKELLNGIVNSIESPNIKDWVHEVLDNAPASFMEKRASRNHHLPDEREVYGNILHTVRVARIVVIMCDVLGIGGHRRDVLMAAAVPHDLCRYGLHDECEVTSPVHPRLVELFVLENNIESKLWGDAEEEIYETIEGHMGRWGTPPCFLEEGSNAMILHMADCIEAKLPEIL